MVEPNDFVLDENDGKQVDAIQAQIEKALREKKGRHVQPMHRIWEEVSPNHIGHVVWVEVARRFSDARFSVRIEPGGSRIDSLVIELPFAR